MRRHRDRIEALPYQALFSRRWLLIAMMVVVAAAATFWGVASRAQGAEGDNLRQFTAQVPACADNPLFGPVGTGIAFDGSTLYLSCWFSGDLQRVSPMDGSSLGAIHINGINDDIGALSWDATRQKLWACSGGPNVYLIDVGTATAAYQFTVTDPNGCSSGLAYDHSDDTLWTSCNNCGTVSHYTTSGTLIASYPGMFNKLGGAFGSAGLAVGGASLYVSNDEGHQIYRCSKDLSDCSLFATFTQKVEDLECDDVTFSPKTAIWSQDRFDRILNAWETTEGSCNGGETATPTVTASATAASTATTPPQSTATNTPPATETSTAVASETSTAVASETNTPITTETSTAVATQTSTEAPTETGTVVAATGTPELTETATGVASSTSTAIATQTETSTPAPSSTSTPLASGTSTVAATGTSTAEATNTSMPAATNTSAAASTSTSTPAASTTALAATSVPGTPTSGPPRVNTVLAQATTRSGVVPQLPSTGSGEPPSSGGSTALIVALGVISMLSISALAQATRRRRSG